MADFMPVAVGGARDERLIFDVECDSRAVGHCRGDPSHRERRHLERVRGVG